MAKIPELTDDVEVIQKLGRRPNSDDGLTEAGFKAKFDEAGIAIKKFINQYVVPAINDYVVSTDGLLDKAGGTMTGDIAMSGNKITGLGAPSDNADAANKNYVDAVKTYVDGKRVTATAVLAKTWEGTGPYTQTVAVSGILSSDMPHITPVYKSDASDTDAIVEGRIEQWARVSYAEAVAGGIKFTCLESPDFNYLLKIQIEVMR